MAFRFAEAFISLKADIRPMMQSLDRAQRKVELWASAMKKVTVGGKIDESFQKMAKSIDRMSNSMSRASAKFARSSIMYRRSAKSIERAILGSMIPSARRANREFSKFAGHSAKFFVKEFGRAIQNAGRKVSRGGIIDSLDRVVTKTWRNKRFRGAMKGVRNTPYLKDIFDLYNVPQKIKAPNLSVAYKKATRRVGSQAAIFGAFMQNHPNTSGFGKWIGRQFENIGVAIHNDKVKKAVGNAIKGFGKFISDQAPAIQKATKSAFKGAGDAILDTFKSFIKYVKPIQGIQVALGALVGTVGTALSRFMKFGGYLLGAFGKILGTVTNVIGGAARGIAKLGLALSIGIGAGLMFSAKAAGDVEYLMVNIGRVADISGKKLEKLKQELLGIAKASTGADTREILQIAEFGARLGVGEGSASKETAIAKFTKDIAKLKLALDDLPVEEATTKIVRILNVFGEGHDKILNFASALTRLDNASTATGKDILDLTRRLSGVAGTMGMLPEDVMALAAAMRDMGIEVEVGGTSVSQLLVRMSADAETFAKVMKLSAKELKHQIDTNPLNAVRMVLQALSKYNPRSQLAMISQLHLQGQRTSSTILQLSKGFSKLDQFINMARDDWESLNAVEEASALRSQTLWAKLTKLSNQFTVLRVEIGDRIMPALKEFAEFLGEFLDAALQVIKRNGEAIDGFVRRVTDSITFLRASILDWRKSADIVTEYIEIKMEALGDVFLSLGKSIVDYLKAAIPVVMDGAYEIGKSIVRGIQDGIVENFSIIPSIQSSIVDYIRGSLVKGMPGTFKKGAGGPKAPNMAWLDKLMSLNISGAFTVDPERAKKRQERLDALDKKKQGMVDLFASKGGLTSTQILASRAAGAASGIAGSLANVSTNGIFPYKHTDKKIQSRSVEREKQYERQVAFNKMATRVRKNVGSVMETGKLPSDIRKRLASLSIGDLDRQNAKDVKFYNTLEKLFPTTVNGKFSYENMKKQIKASGGEPRLGEGDLWGGFRQDQQNAPYWHMRDRLVNYSGKRRDLQNFYGGNKPSHEKGADEKTRDQVLVKGLGVIGKTLTNGLGLAGRVAGALNAAPGLQAAGIFAEKTSSKFKRKRKTKGSFGGMEAGQVDENYKPEFFDLADFSRKIQQDIYNKKNNDPTINAVDNIGNKMDEYHKYFQMILGGGSDKPIAKSLQDLSTNGMTATAG